MPSLIARYDALTEQTLQPDPAQRTVVEALEDLRLGLINRPGRLMRFFGADEGPAGVYMWGAVGVGKSMLVDLLLENLEAVPRRRYHFQGFMQDLHKALHGARGGEAGNPVMAATDTLAEGLALLALDEVEITDIADAMIVGRVFARLRELGVSVVATSNKAPSDLYKNGLKRDVFLPFVALIEDSMHVIRLDGAQDYRRSERQQRNVYFPAGTDRIEQLWQDIDVSEETYDLLRSTLTIRRKGQAVRATFDQLCRVAVGAAQYRRMVTVADRIFVENVPRLGPRDEDAARRFIMLIDAVYDLRKTLIISAADDPDGLYHGEDFAVEFRRTASRLHEMRADGWPENAIR